MITRTHVIAGVGALVASTALTATTAAAITAAASAGGPRTTVARPGAPAVTVEPATPPTVAYPSASETPSASESTNPLDATPTSETPTPDAPTSASDVPPPGGPVVPLTENAPATKVGSIDDQPYLAFRLGPDWKHTVVDEKGYDEYQNATTRCRLSTYVGSGDLGTSDAAASRRSLTAIQTEIKKKLPSATFVPAPDVVINRSSGRPLAFAQQRLTYTRKDNGAKWTAAFLARGLSKDRVELTLTASCPASTLADPAALPALVSQGKVVSAFAPR